MKKSVVALTLLAASAQAEVKPTQGMEYFGTNVNSSTSQFDKRLIGGRQEYLGIYTNYINNPSEAVTNTFFWKLSTDECLTYKFGTTADVITNITYKVKPLGESTFASYDVTGHVEYNTDKGVVCLQKGKHELVVKTKHGSSGTNKTFWELGL